MACAMLGISVQVEPGLQDQALLTLLKQQLVGFVPPVLTVHPVLPPLRVVHLALTTVSLG